MSQAACAVCHQPESESSPLQMCRGCGYAAHTACHRGPKLCPKCAKPLVTKSAAKGFEEGHAKGKRRIEYRFAGLIWTAGFLIVAAGTIMALAVDGWNWLSIPFGTPVVLILALAAGFMAARFLKSPRPSTAILALGSIGLAVLLYIPGVYGQLQSLLTGRLGILFTSAIALAPFAMVPLALREYYRWKQVPGTSAGAGREGLQGTFDASNEALQEIGVTVAKKIIKR
jgi:hypothetical protein